MSYGLWIDGKNDNSDVAMLVKIIPTPVGSAGEYVAPELPLDVRDKYRQFFTLLYSDTQYGKSDFLSPGNQGEIDIVVARADVLPVKGRENAPRVQWQTARNVSDVWRNEASVVAILLWREKVA